MGDSVGLCEGESDGVMLGAFVGALLGTFVCASVDGASIFVWMLWFFFVVC